nr:AsmA family protein [Georgfuchsia toluolica]
MLSRTFKWTAVLLLVPVLLAVLCIVFFPWNMLREPIERLASEKTGRALVINGDLKAKLGWSLPRIHADAVSFANPGWAREKQMVTADAVEIVIDLPQLLRKKIVLSEVWLEHPVIFLEQGSAGRKNWLLDINQQDEGARIRIDRLTLDKGHLGYDASWLRRCRTEDQYPRTAIDIARAVNRH